MLRNPASLSDAYISRLRTFDRARVKIERLLLADHVTRQDACLLYEGIFLRTVTTCEGLMEDLFVGLLAGGIKPGRSVHPRVQFKSYTIARDIVLGGRAYVDWLPFNVTEKRADAFFRGGYPFRNLEKNDKKELERVIFIRNAIAHQSRSASEKFEKEVIGGTPLLSAERTPAGYLRSIFRASPAQTRYEEIASTCAMLARKLCA